MFLQHQVKERFQHHRGKIREEKSKLIQTLNKRGNGHSLQSRIKQLKSALFDFAIIGMSASITADYRGQLRTLEKEKKRDDKKAQRRRKQFLR